MVKGVVKSGKGTLIGNAGEYFVVAELLRRGMIAALAPRNAPAIDILADDGKKMIKIRVKSKSDPSLNWQWGVKKDGCVHRNIANEDYCILVDLKTIGHYPDFYMFKTKEIDDLIKKRFEEWLKTPGKNNRPHDPNNKHRSIVAHKEVKILIPRKNKWEFLGLNSD